MARNTIVLFFFLIFLSTLWNCGPSGGKKIGPDRPNVILILTDDQGWGDVGIHGNEKISTPTINQMALNGAQFERFYVSPLCAPTRASLLTGRYYLRTGTSWVSKGLENMSSREVTLAEIFRSQGYATGCFGKWHNGAHFPQHPNQQGFDQFIGFCAGHWNNYFNTTLEHNGKPYPTQGYITDVLTTEALKFIETNKDREFFCYIPFNAPHGPFQVPDTYFNKYKKLGFNDKDAAVYGMCENIDENTGRIIQKVEELGLSENTVIIFLTDNGPNGQRYNGGMRGVKGSIHEGGVRVPCIINWKGKIFHKPIKDIAGHIDLLPTLVSLCDLDPPETLPLDGVDLSDLILGNDGISPERIFFTKRSTESIVPDGAARTDKYRFVIERGDTMLFDMEGDPGQENNVASEKREITASLAKAYNHWIHEMTSEYMPDTEIRIGFDNEISAYLPAHEASFSGDIHFMEGHGWAHDWLVNWKRKADSIYWEIIVEQPSAFHLELLYSCPEKNVGSQIVASTEGDKVQSEIKIPHDPDYMPSPDRVKRIEVYEKKWASLSLGNLKIQEGSQRITLKASTIPNGEVGEVKGLVLNKITSK